MNFAASGPIAASRARGLRPMSAPTIVSLMRQARRSTAIAWLPIAGLIAILVALAILQFRWSGEVSEAERDRLQQNLERASARVQSGFQGDLMGLCRALQAYEPHRRTVVLEQIFSRYNAWRRISGRAPLVKGLYLRPVQAGSPAAPLRFDLDIQKLIPEVGSLGQYARKDGPLPPSRMNGWYWDGGIPGLIHPVYESSPGGSRGRPRIFGYLFVVFDPHYFTQVYLPGLTRRSLPPGNRFVFQLIHRGEDGTRRVMYRSGEDVPAEAFAHPDLAFELLPGAVTSRGLGANKENIALSSGPLRWEIVVRHRAGSLEAAVSGLRRRNLAISLFVLLALAGSLFTILIATLRARRLAKMEMEFASAVSHELRTPLAVICSAADNLADGVILEDSRVRNYGAMIRREGRRLSGMVEHILDFAALHSKARGYEMETLPASEVIQPAIADLHSLLQVSHVSLETCIDPDLPPLHTDRRALGQCLDNLLSNALKYGASGGRIQVSAATSPEHRDRILITVRDFGQGIPDEDLPYIFDPFYRGEAAKNSPVRGTGLGLSLCREIIEALGGSLTAESSPGKGASFILEIPAGKTEPLRREAPEYTRLA